MVIFGSPDKKPNITYHSIFTERRGKYVTFAFVECTMIFQIASGQHYEKSDETVISKLYDWAKENSTDT